MVGSQTDEIVLFRIRGIVEKGLGHLWITSSSSLFFNNIDSKLYLFKRLSLYLVAQVLF